MLQSGLDATDLLDILGIKFHLARALLEDCGAAQLPVALECSISEAECGKQDVFLLENVFPGMKDTAQPAGNIYERTRLYSQHTQSSLQPHVEIYTVSRLQHIAK